MHGKSVFLALDQINAWIVVKQYDNKHNAQHNTAQEHKHITISNQCRLPACLPLCLSDAVVLLAFTYFIVVVCASVLLLLFVTDLFED